MFELRYVEDESVQSWIFRCLQVAGCTDFSSVLSGSGSWFDTPSFGKYRFKCRPSVNDQLFLDFLWRSKVERKRVYESCSNPVKYIDSLTYLVGANYGNKLCSTTPIRFCSQCIQDSIALNGFAYFKASWLFDDMCSKHGMTLSRLNAKTPKESLPAIQSILQGRFLSTDVQTSNSGISHSQRIRPQQFDAFIMPCLIDDLYQWICINDFSFENDVMLDKFYNRVSFRPSIDKVTLERIFFDYKDNRPEKMESFIEQRLAAKLLRYGLTKKNSLSLTLFKSKKHNCSKCTRWYRYNYCPNSIIHISDPDGRRLSDREDVTRLPKYWIGYFFKQNIKLFVPQSE